MLGDLAKLIPEFVMVSAVDLAKRALVALLKSLAAVYNVSVSVTRDGRAARCKKNAAKILRRGL